MRLVSSVGIAATAIVIAVVGCAAGEDASSSSPTDPADPSGSLGSSGGVGNPGTCGKADKAGTNDVAPDAPSGSKSVGDQVSTTSCLTTAYGGRATVLRANVQLLPAQVALSDTSELPADGGVRTGELAALDVLSLVSAGASTARVAGFAGDTEASAQVASLRLWLGAVSITADAIESRAHAWCGGATGGAKIANLTVNGVPVEARTGVNETVVIGPLQLVFNEQVWKDGALSINALRASVLGVADVTVASAKVSVECSCKDAGPAEDAASNDAGADAGGPCDGGWCPPDALWGPDGGTGGLLGSPCDGSRPCSDGYACLR